MYIIYTFGNGEILKGLFDSIAMVLNSHTGTLYQPFIRISFIVSAFWATIYAIYGDQIKVFTAWIIPSLMIVNLLFAPHARVLIVDPATHYHDRVDHVPYGLAAFASYISRFGKVATEEVERIFALPNDLKYHKTGMLFAGNILQQARTFHIVDENLAENMRQFVGQCVVYDALLGLKYTIDDLRNNEDIWRLVSERPSPVRAFLWQDRGRRPEIITCQEGVRRFEAQWRGLITRTSTLWGRKIFGKSATIDGNRELLKHLPLAYGFLTNTARSADQIIQQNIMIHSIVDGIEKKSTALGNAPNFATKRAYLQQRTAYESLGAMAADTLPAMKAVLEGLAYAAFILILPIALLPFGYRFLLSWAQVVLWLQMWAPLYAVLNYMMTMAARSKSLAALSLSNEAGHTIASSVGLAAVNADISAMAGYLAMSIPFISIALVKGVGSFVHLASHLSNVSQGTAQSAAHEATTGNYSFGNISQGTSQIANTQMLSHSNAAQYRARSFQESDGRSELLTVSDGSQIGNILTPNLPLNLNVAETQSRQLSQMASKSQSQGISLSESASKNLASSYRQFADLSDHLSKSEHFTAQSSTSQTAENTKAINKASNLVQEFAKQQNLSQGQAAQVLAEVGVGGGIGFVSGSVKSSLSGSIANYTVRSEAERYTQSKDFQETMRESSQAVKSLSHSTGDEQAKRMSEGISGSLEQSEHMREEANKHFRQAEDYQRQASHTQSLASSINASYTQEFVSWLASQGAPNTKGNLGMRGAMHIIANEPALRQQYAERFMEEKALVPQPIPNQPTHQPLAHIRQQSREVTSTAEPSMARVVEEKTLSLQAVSAQSAPRQAAINTQALEQPTQQILAQANQQSQEVAPGMRLNHAHNVGQTASQTGQHITSRAPQENALTDTRTAKIMEGETLSSQPLSVQLISRQVTTSAQTTNPQAMQEPLAQVQQMKNETTAAIAPNATDFTESLLPQTRAAQSTPRPAATTTQTPETMQQPLAQVKQQSQAATLGIEPSRAQNVEQTVVTTQKKIQEDILQTQKLQDTAQQQLQQKVREEGLPKVIKKRLAEVIKKLPPEGF